MWEFSRVCLARRTRGNHASSCEFVCVASSESAFVLSRFCIGIETVSSLNCEAIILFQDVAWFEVSRSEISVRLSLEAGVAKKMKESSNFEARCPNF